MKKRLYDLSHEPIDKSDRINLISAYYVVLDLLSEEDEQKIKTEFKEYMDSCNKNGIKYIPAYLWVLNKVKIFA